MVFDLQKKVAKNQRTKEKQAHFIKVYQYSTKFTKFKLNKIKPS